MIARVISHDIPRVINCFPHNSCYIWLQSRFRYALYLCEAVSFTKERIYSCAESILYGPNTRKLQIFPKTLSASYFTKSIDDKFRALQMFPRSISTILFEFLT